MLLFTLTPATPPPTITTLGPSDLVAADTRRPTRVLRVELAPRVSSILDIDELTIFVVAHSSLRCEEWNVCSISELSTLLFKEVVIEYICSSASTSESDFNALPQKRSYKVLAVGTDLQT